ncbi:hypothetical protein QF028_006514 [Neobacillus sp. B4I6]
MIEKETKGFLMNGYVKAHCYFYSQVDWSGNQQPC